MKKTEPIPNEDQFISLACKTNSWILLRILSSKSKKCYISEHGGKACTKGLDVNPNLSSQNVSKKNTSNKWHFEQNCVLTEIQNKQIM